MGVVVCGQRADVAPAIRYPADRDPHGEDQAAEEQKPPERDADEREGDPQGEQERLQAGAREVDLLADGRHRRVERAHAT